MKDLAQEIVRHLSAGEPVGLCTVVATKGSTPQSRGAKMLVLADGRTVGTLGGGCVEAEVRRRALEQLGSGASITSRFSLDQDYGWDDGLICGGVMDIHVSVLGGADVDRFAAIADALRADRSTSLEFSYELDGRAARYVEDLGPPPTLLIVGAGHVGAALAKLASELDFRVDVIDDRADALTAERFPGARRRITGEIESELRNYPIAGDTYVVIVTRGHKNDGRALSTAIGRGSKYLGLIGSKRKIKAIFDELANSGVDRQLLLDVHAPIGLEIGAVSVAEIALSIAAELVAVRRGRTGQVAGPMKMREDVVNQWLDRK
jgi:xanthine dehydrogenase accessory factor